MLAFVLELNCLLCTYCTLIPFWTLYWVSRFNSGARQGGVAFSELLWVLLTMETTTYSSSRVSNHTLIPESARCKLQGTSGETIRPSDCLQKEAKSAFIANAGWIIPHFFSHFYSPTPRSRSLFPPHLFASRIRGKLSPVICFIPVPPSCDIDLRFFIRVVVDHNHTKSCEATLSYQSSLRGIWLRDHVSCSGSQACCRPFRHMPSHRDRRGESAFDSFISIVKLCVHANVGKVDDLSNTGSQGCLKRTSGSPFPSLQVPHASLSI